ncbi:MAG: sugar phosphate isomerase/epimerase [Planctomycetales bacterium]|nr:sugar phosphate isomerase/epimerase [Planctomycetales bacterium]
MPRWLSSLSRATETEPNTSSIVGDWPVRYCLNTSTIRGQQLGLVAEIELAAKAGYDGIEPWIREIEVYQQEGGSLADLRKRLDDHGLRVESAIGFPQWIVDDPEARARGLEQAKREMGLVAALGGTRIAAPPAGATDRDDMDLLTIAERYRALLEVGRAAGVVPQLELWGFSKTIHRLGELLYIATEADHPDACVLPDVYHIYKGGSGFDGLRMLAGTQVHCFHMNDYPADPPRETIGDADRVYPGDGVAPLDEILGTLRRNGFAGVLSLELFNPRYYELDAEEVVTTGLEKMKAAVESSMAAS